MGVIRNKSDKNSSTLEILTNSNSLLSVTCYLNSDIICVILVPKEDDSSDSHVINIKTIAEIDSAIEQLNQFKHLDIRDKTYCTKFLRLKQQSGYWGRLRLLD